MSHELEAIVRAAYTGKAAWHDLGKVADRRMLLPEFLEFARMNYTVEKVPAFAPEVALVDGILRVVVGGTPTIVPNQFHLQRNGINGDGNIVSDKTVSSRYAVCQPRDIGAILANVVEQGWGTFDSAFTLRGGQTEIVTVRLDDVEKDVSVIDPGTVFLVARNRHGSGTADFVVSRTRTVCANTERVSFMDGADLSYRHCKGPIDAMKQATEIWESAKLAVRGHAEKLAKLASKTCHIPNTIDALLGIAGKPASEVTAQKKTRRNELIDAASLSPGTSGRTLLDVYNGVTFMATHDKSGRGGDDDDMRLASLLDGSREKTTVDALDTLLLMA